MIDFVNERSPYGLAASDCRLIVEAARGDLTYICEISIQLPGVNAVMTRCKFPSLNIKIQTGELRQTLNNYLDSIMVRRRVLPHDFHSLSLRELSTKGFVDKHLRLNPA